ncbi:MAG: endolytic transglycosylase MltG [Patescibacteria group bacterium]
MKLFIFLIIGLAIIAAALAGGNFIWQITRPVAVSETDRKFTILPGQTVKQVSRLLAEKKMIASDFWFRTYVWLRRAENKFIAGDYVLPPKLNSLELVNILTQINPRPVKTVKILEGWGIGDIAGYLKNQGWSQEELISLVGRPGVFGSPNNDFYNDLSLRSELLLARTAGAPLEGYLFPDTYEVFADAPVKDIVVKMVDNFNSKFTPDLRAEIVRQGKNPYKVLIMASIIEAEVPHEADRAIISDIFWSRLVADVALQSDATLKYIIGGQRPALTSSELKIDSVYNSYKNKGLPPTPIGNPGLSAIKAAIYPAQTDYFYFLSTPEGQTIFSRTLGEHNRAKNQYLR